VRFTLAPPWLDSAEIEGSITPLLALHAIHDAVPCTAPYEDVRLRP
jgi:hypothetical protein